MHPQPAAGFAFALHLLDEILAFFRSDGDTLHGRPYLWWLDGFGVFTMLQEEMAVCEVLSNVVDWDLIARRPSPVGFLRPTLH